jgi:hypothetical protein
MSEIKDSLFTKYIDSIAGDPGVTFKKDNISFVGILGNQWHVTLKNGTVLTASDYTKQVSKKIKYEWMCRECSDRASKYCKTVFSNGVMLCKNRTDLMTRYPKSAHYLITEVLKKLSGHSYCMYSLKIVTKNDVDPIISGSTTHCVPASSGGGGDASTDTQVVEEFKHHYIPYSTVTDDSVQFTKMQLAFNKYTKLFHDMFLKITDLYNSKMALETAIPILKAADNGKIALPCAIWMLSVLNSMKKSFMLMNLYEKMDFIGKTILGTSISDCTEYNDSVTEMKEVYIPVYHTFNSNLSDLMVKAKNISAFKRMVQDRFHVLKFKQKTAEPTLYQLNTAAKSLGDFDLIVHSTSDIEKHTDTYTIKGTNECGGETSMSVLDTLRKNKMAEKTTGFASFATRAQYNDYSHITTLSQLYKLCDENKVHSLQIDCTKGRNSAYGCYGTYTVKTTLAQEKLAFVDNNEKYMWCYLLNESGRFVGTHTVTHVKKIKSATRDNALFVIKNSRDTLVNKPLPSAYCGTEFLSSAYQRKYGATFAEIGRNMFPKIQSVGDISLGVGVSTKDDYGNLFTKIYLYINGSDRVSIISSQ